jgi:hypothetical protein
MEDRLVVYDIHLFSSLIYYDVKALSGNGSLPAIRARNNTTNVYSSLLGNNQCANGLARWLSYDLFSVWCALRNTRTMFSVRGPCREDMREYGNGN